jgi:hypothetical protein
MPRLSESQRIKRMLDLREEIRADEAALKKKKEKHKEMEDQAINMLLKKGLQKMSLPGGGTISVNEEDVAQVDDWDKLYAYVRKNNAFYLLYRRVNPASWREEVASRKNKALPGVSTYTKYKLSLRKTPN